MVFSLRFHREFRVGLAALSAAILLAGCGHHTSAASSSNDTYNPWSPGPFSVNNSVSGKKAAEAQVEGGLLAKHQTATAASTQTQHAKHFCTKAEVAAGTCQQ